MDQVAENRRPVDEEAKDEVLAKQLEESRIWASEAMAYHERELMRAQAVYESAERGLAVLHDSPFGQSRLKAVGPSPAADVRGSY